MSATVIRLHAATGRQVDRRYSVELSLRSRVDISGATSKRFR